MAKSKKIFVLDTSVILYDHNSFKNFQDNDVVIPITVIEELDNFKKGDDTKNYQAREFIRILDRLSSKESLLKWNPIGEPSTGKFMVYLTKKEKEYDVNHVFNEYKNDHEILNTVLEVKKDYPKRQVVLVTKDINFRLKARSLNIEAEDFETGKVKNLDKLYTGKTTITLPRGIIDGVYEKGFLDPVEFGLENMIPNHYYILKDSNKSSALTTFNYNTGKLERIEKKSAYRILPRNAEQVFALHAILNPEVKLVTLQGVAGTGKTLLSLAGAIEQKKNYRQIFLARPIVPLSNRETMGFLPGDVKSKLDPYMEPLWDNLKYIQHQFDDSDKEFKFITESLENEKIVVTPLSYIRGRSISNVFFIIDEAQNLTPHEVKTIITRAGEGTKLVFTGDINQIDTPYLDKESNGLSYIIDKIKSHPIYAHIKLEKGERSELANLANDLL